MKKEKANKLKVTAKKFKEKVRKKSTPCNKKKANKLIVNIVPRRRDFVDKIRVSPMRNCGRKGSTRAIWRTKI